MNKPNYETDFPILQPSLFNHDFYFQYELVYLYFHSFRKTKIDIDLLSERLENVLYLLKKELKNDKYYGITIYYLNQFYKLLAHTRDMVDGKGEHHIVYQWIFIWYKYFPTLAIYFIHCLSYNGIIENLGCWRDMKYLCDYVRQHSLKKEKHPIVLLCIELMNKQLKKDSINYLQNSLYISTVSKWIPREKKQFDWLYTLLVIDWFSLLNSKIYIENLNKYKMKYRKIVSLLNASIDTTQIKQCSLQYDEINPAAVSKHTLMKNNCLLYKTNFHKDVSDKETEKREQCYQTFKNHIEQEKTKKRFIIHGDKPSSSTALLPLSYYIKEAFLLLSIPSTETDLEYRKNILNKQWSKYKKKFSEQLKKCVGNKTKHIIPFVDISYSIQIIDSESYYTSIGLCLLLCSHSLFGNNAFFVDNKPTWVSFDNTNDNLVEMIEIIHSATKSAKSTIPDITSAIDMFVYTVQKMITNSKDIHDMFIVYISDFSICSNDNKIIGSLYDKIHQRFFIEYTENIIHGCIPNMAFWNVSKYNLFELPCSIYKERVCFLSGFSPNIMKMLFSNGNGNGINKTIKPYDTIIEILNDVRYDVFQNYISEMVHTY
jgi:hypothetical protein